MQTPGLTSRGGGPRARGRLLEAGFLSVQRQQSGCCGGGWWRWGVVSGQLIELAVFKTVSKVKEGYKHGGAKRILDWLRGSMAFCF